LVLVLVHFLFVVTKQTEVINNTHTHTYRRKNKLYNHNNSTETKVYDFVKMSYYSGSSSRSNISTKKDYDVVFKSSGSKPLERCLSSGSVSRVYDKTSKGYVLALSGGRSTNVHFPKKKTASLGLTSTRPYLVLQVYVPVGRPFTCEVVISDDKLTRRRLIFSTAFKEELYGELHAQISLQNLERGRWLNVCIDMLSIMGVCFENDGKTNFRVCDAITVSSVCKLRSVYVVRENPYGKGGLPLELAFSNGVDSKYVLYDGQHILDRRSVDEVWDDQQQSNVSVYGIGSEMGTPSKRRFGSNRNGITSTRRGGGFGNDVSGSDTTPKLAFGTRFTPSPNRNKSKERRNNNAHGKKSRTPPRSANQNRSGDRNKFSLGIKNMKLHGGGGSERKAPVSARKSPASVSGASYITPKLNRRALVNRHTSPMAANDRYDHSPQYTVPPATPNTPYESPALKRTPISQALTLEQTPPSSPVRQQRQPNTESMLNAMEEQIDDDEEDIAEDEKLGSEHQGSEQQKVLTVPSVLYDGRKYDIYEEETEGELEFNNNSRREVNSSLDSDELYGDVIGTSNNSNENGVGENENVLTTNDCIDKYNDDNISDISVHDEDNANDTGILLQQEDNSINAEYDLQFENRLNGREDTRTRESVDIDDDHEAELQLNNSNVYDNNEEDNYGENNVSLESDLSDKLVTYGERVDLNDDDQDDMVTMEEENVEEQMGGEEHLEGEWNVEEDSDNNEDESISSNVATLSDDLTRKREMLEEKRRKLLELEQSYLEEFGNENEDDIEVVDIEVRSNNKENVVEGTNNGNVIEAAVVTKDNTEEEDDIRGQNEELETIDNSQNFNSSKEASVELIYDPVLACYFDPKSGKYYEIQQ
jgi:hypothetical protein